MLTIVWHSRTGAAQALAQSACDGADEAASGQCRLIRAEACDSSLLLEATGYVFVCPENLGSLPGEMKEMFDRSYYPLLGKVEGRPYATIVAAGSDGQGAQSQIDRIVTGWRLRRAAPPIIVNLGAQTVEAILSQKVVPQTELARARDLGALLAEGLGLGIF